MVDVAPQLHEICQHLLLKLPYRFANPELMVHEIKNAERYGDLYVCYWRVFEGHTRYLCLFRLDRAPTNEEILPWLQELFLNGTIHEVSDPTQNYREFFQGTEIYKEEVLATKIAEAIADYAERKDEIHLAPDLEN